MDNGALDDIVARAVDVARAATTPTEFAEIWTVLRPARAFGRRALDSGLGLLAGELVERRVGCELLSVLCDPDDGGWTREVATAVVAAATDESDDDLCWSIAGALGVAGDPIGVPTLVRLAGHDDAGVRWKVATALPECASPGERGDSVISAALVDLTEDEYDDVRDWATFGLGQLTDTDSLSVRDALVRRLGDADDETRHEALVGLARRHDPRAVPATAAALRAESVFLLAVDAASYLADPSLFPDLIRLRDWWDVDPNLLETAIRRCDPDLRRRDDAWMTEFLQALQHALDSSGGVPSTAGLMCDLLDYPDAKLFVEPSTARSSEPPDRVWDIDGLRQRAGTEDVASAVALVVADLSSGAES